MTSRMTAYFETLRHSGDNAVATDNAGSEIGLDAAIERVIAAARAAHATGNKLMFIGNGGSAAIASHMAIDYSKNGDLRSLAFNDGAALTCLGNDFGFEEIFARQIELHARPGDVLVAISSSGKSADILRGVAAARARDCLVVTLSGFSPDNPLRRLGDVNLYVADDRYGVVEITHLALCHAVVDLASSVAPADQSGFAWSR